MCPDCEKKELELTEQSELETNVRLAELAERNKQKMQDARDEVKSYGEFFNARVTPIVQVKELYELNGHKFEEFHERIKLQIEHFARVLFEQHIETPEDSISKLLIEFRAEIRQKIKESDINYNPPSKAPKVNAPRVKQSPIEKMATMMVANAAKSGKIISMSEAIRKLQFELGIK